MTGTHIKSFTERTTMPNKYLSVMGLRKYAANTFQSTKRKGGKVYGKSYRYHSINAGTN